MFAVKWLGNKERLALQKWLAVALALLLLGIGVPSPARPAIAQGPSNDLPVRNLYMPLIQDTGSPATPVATTVAGAHVYGLVGSLSTGKSQVYSYYLTTANNGYYALAGETPEIDQRIANLAVGNSPSVKIWGDVLPPEVASEPPLIVVTGILGTEVTPAPPVSGASAPVAVVKFNVVNLYGGPGTSYQVVGQVVARQACEVTGRNQNNSWLQLTCADGQQGWVDARLVEVNGSLGDVIVISTTAPTPTATPAPPTVTPLPTPAAISGWRMDVYNNTALAGPPIATLDVPNIGFNWGSNGPVPGIVDNFAVRFTRRIATTPGFYQFTATADDGVRVWVDGRLIINAWPATAGQSYNASLVLSGSNDIQVDYYEQSGLASVSLQYHAAPAESPWQASYYYGTTPTGNPAFSQQEPRGSTPLDYNWGSGGPSPQALGVTSPGSDYWSARWQGDFTFDTGNFVFRANVDDGVRLYLDGLLVLDNWRDGYKEVSNRVLGIGSGRHTVVVEYYERTGNASIQLWWYRDSAYVGPQ